jgi:hypothetical protein
MLEGETTLEAFLPKQRRWLAAGATAPIHLYPVIVVSKSINSSREAAAGFLWRLLNMADISSATNLVSNNATRGGQRRLWSQLLIIIVLVGAQRTNPKKTQDQHRIADRGYHDMATQGNRWQRQGAKPLNH